MHNISKQHIKMRLINSTIDIIDELGGSVNVMFVHSKDFVGPDFIFQNPYRARLCLSGPTVKNFHNDESGISFTMVARGGEHRVFIPNESIAVVWAEENLYCITTFGKADPTWVRGPHFNS